MIDKLKGFFGKPQPNGSKEASQVSEHDVRVAVCALFVEMARIDESFTAEEMAAVIDILKEKYGLSAENAAAMITAAEAELEQSVDYWQFARLINENYSMNEKIGIIEMLWRIVYLDGSLDKHEDYLMHKLAKLLRLHHKQLMDAKLKILRSRPE